MRMSRRARPQLKRGRGIGRRVLDIGLTAAILLFGILLAARFERVETRDLSGAAVVNDGDSLTIGGERVRLRGIDAPELDQICRVGQGDYPCGRRSRAALAELIGGRTVTCTGWERDRYGRLLAECRAGGTDLNRSQVEAGWAVAYGSHRDAEAEARQASRGLWAGDFQRPRDWRVQHGGLAEVEHGAINRLLNWLTRTFRLG